MKPKNDKWNQYLDAEERALDAAIEASPDPVPADPATLAQVRGALETASHERRTSHGGSRPGAGRPSRAGVRTMLRLSPESREALETLAHRRRSNLSETASEIILAAAGRRDSR